METIPNEIVNLTINLTNVQTDPVDGDLVLTHGGEIIAKKRVSTSKITHEIKFIAPEEEGVYNYRLEFMQGNDSKTYTEFSISVSLLDVQLMIPEFVDETANVTVQIFLKTNGAMNCTIKDYFTNSEGDLLNHNSILREIQQGYNEINFTYTGLNREDQSYDVIVALECQEYERILSGSIVTNHYPIISYIDTVVVNESEDVVIVVNATDPDNDTLSYSINDSRFSQNNNMFMWQTYHADIGEYRVLINVSDGLLTESQVVEVVVENKLPVANFSYSPEMPTGINQRVTFTDYSYDPGGTIVSWFWDFGDGTDSTEQNPIHSYSENGTYLVTLTITDDSGDSSSMGEVIDVLEISCPSGGVSTCQGTFCCGDLDGICPEDFENVSCLETDPD